MRSATPLTSAHNPLLKEVRRAHQRGGLTADGLCLAESPHLLTEALRSGCTVHAVLVAESASARLPASALRVLPVSDAVFETIATTATTQGVLALVEPPRWEAARLFPAARTLVVILDGVQDPGNAGTIARAAEAFGASGLLFLKGCVSPHHPKTLRASAGSLFRVPHHSALTVEEVRVLLDDHAVPLRAAVPDRGEPCWDTDLTGPLAFAVGSEGHGLQPDLEALARPVRIPTEGVESLNVAMAASVFLYEAHRQRRAFRLGLGA